MKYMKGKQFQSSAPKFCLGRWFPLSDLMLRVREKCSFLYIFTHLAFPSWLLYWEEYTLMALSSPAL